MNGPIVLEIEVYEAFRTIIKNRESKAVNYAVNYAKAGIGMTGRALQVQILYVLNNIGHWRGTEATWVRNILKGYKG